MYADVVAQVVARVRARMTDDLLNKKWRGKKRPDDPPGFGHCYIAAEAVWHILGGPKSGLVPQVIRGKDWTHWFLRSRDGMVIVDPTADQHDGNYRAGRGCGFMTREPSRRARILMGEV